MSGMRILIVSDTHRRDGNFRRVLEKTGPIDMLIHLGDTEGSESYFREWVDNDVCVIHVVRGNNDFFSFCDREKEISIGRYRALLTHGHMYGVSLGTEGIKDEARARKVDIVMYGHTHKPHLEYCRDGPGGPESWKPFLPASRRREAVLYAHGAGPPGRGPFYHLLSGG